MTQRAIVKIAGLTLFTFALFCAADTHADTYPRVHGFDVIEYVFRLTLTDENDSIEGLATIDALRTEPGVSSLPLDLVGASSENTTGMTVSAVWVSSAIGLAALGPRPTERERGQRAEFDHDGDRLTIDLTGHADAQRVRVTIAYTGSPATGLQIKETQHGDRAFFSDNWPNRARHWLPTIDHPYDKAKSQMIVVAPSHYQVISNGLLVEQTDLPGGTRLTHWRQSVPIATWLYVLGVAHFAVQHLDEFDGKPVQTWVYPQDRVAGFYDFAVPTHEVLTFFSEKVGPFSYEKLANIQSHSLGGGMEAASAIFYGEDSVTGERTVGIRNVIIHEIAHQWFGNSVTEDDWDDVWLSEGFATYFTLLFREHAYGRDDFVDGLHAASDRVFAFYEERPNYRLVHENLDDMSKVTTGMQYRKGAWTLHMLRGFVGTETFWKGIRLYYARYQNGSANTADFRGVMEEVSGMKLEWFFDQWLRQGGLPTITGTWYHADGALRLDLRQTQPTYHFRLPLEVLLRFDDGATQREAIQMTDAVEQFTLETKRSPSAVVLDPDTWMLLKSEITRKEP